MSEKETRPDLTDKGLDHDINLRVVLPTGIGLFLLVILGSLSMWGLLAWMTQREEAENRSEYPLAIPEQRKPLSERLPAEPRLEGLDLRSPIRSGVPGWPSMAPKLAASEKEHLRSYGWVKKSKGIAHIPIERAMTLLDGKLPMRSEESGGKNEDAGGSR